MTAWTSTYFVTPQLRPTVALSMQSKMGNLILFFAKPKVAPLIRKSLPTLELLSVFTGFKCLKNLLKTFKKFKINNVYFAVDAQVVLSWLLSDDIKTKNLFAKNRVNEINSIKKDLLNTYKISIYYKFVPTLENPADMLTRGLTFEKFHQHLRFWYNGPDWLNSQSVVWPTSDLNCLSAQQKSVVLSTVLNKDAEVAPLVAFDRYSKLSTLFAVTARVIGALLKFKVLKNDVMIRLWNTPNNMQAAKVHLLQIMQYQGFKEEIQFLREPGSNPVPNLVNSLNLFIGPRGLLRSNGREGKSSYFDDEVLNPIILAKDHLLTKLIVEDCHAQVKHLGLQPTINKIRLLGFWITKPFQSVKVIFKNCITCQKYNSLSFRYPRVTNLPKHRVNLIRPYLNTGIDFTGHIYVKEGGTERRFYMLVFTCLNIRACHIELVPDMTADQFILAFIHFVNE